MSSILSALLNFSAECRFEELEISSSNGDTQISLAETGELLTVLIGIDASKIDSADFTF
ncbi:hypothetical protein [Myxosarcina sp. GI1]|uniref:hypothetical protein n=1 Tax=Myxosarcina sp. GI1 TaxID=1541065 RepID=UPI0012E0740D|nr:hypothetical protein [Myxosarcina sp. GI1]